MNGSGQLQTRNIFGDGLDQILARVDNQANGASDPSGVYFDLTDRQGSVRAVLNDSGTVMASIAYDSFGNEISVVSPNGAVSDPQDYVGRYTWDSYAYDTATGYFDDRARIYDPASGRWTTQDPLGFDAGDSNLYRYVFNSPTMGTDPSGLDRIIVGRDGTVYWQVEKPGRLFGSWWTDDVGEPIKIGTTDTAQMLKYAKNPTPSGMVEIDTGSGKFTIPLKALDNVARTGSPDGNPIEGAFSSGPSQYKANKIWGGNEQGTLESRVKSTVGAIPGAINRLANEAREKDIKAQRDGKIGAFVAAPGTEEWWAYQDAMLKKMGYSLAYRIMFRVFLPHVDGSGIDYLNKVGGPLAMAASAPQVGAQISQNVRAGMQSNQPVVVGKLNPGSSSGGKNQQNTESSAPPKDSSQPLTNSSQPPKNSSQPPNCFAEGTEVLLGVDSPEGEEELAEFRWNTGTKWILLGTALLGAWYFTRPESMAERRKRTATRSRKPE